MLRNLKLGKNIIFFSCKILNRKELRISSTTTETYKKLTGSVREHGLIGHTFNRKD